MNKLKRLTAVVVVTLSLSLVAFGQTPDCEPGQTSTPPCKSVSVTLYDPEAPGETNTPPATNAVDVFSISEFTVDLLLGWLF